MLLNELENKSKRIPGNVITSHRAWIMYCCQDQTSWEDRKTQTSFMAWYAFLIFATAICFSRYHRHGLIVERESRGGSIVDGLFVGGLGEDGEEVGCCHKEFDHGAYNRAVMKQVSEDCSKVAESDTTVETTSLLCIDYRSSERGRL